MTMHRIALSSLLLLAVALAPLSTPSAAVADTLTIGGIEYKNIRVVGLRDGKLYYEGPSGEKAEPLENIQGIHLDKYPELARADQALKDKDFVSAAGLLRGLSNQVEEDWAQIFVNGKLVYALDQSGQFLDAARAYARLLAINDGPLVQSVMPRKLPEDAETRNAARERLQAELQVARNPAAMQYLRTAIEQLEAGRAEADVNPLVHGGALTGGAEPDVDPIMQMIQGGKAADALKYIEAELQNEDSRVSTSKLLYQRGLCLAAAGNRDQDALLSFMRVVIHFNHNTTEWYTPSLIEAGRICLKLEQPQHASDLLQQAWRLAEGDPELSKQVQELRNQLPKDGDE